MTISSSLNLAFIRGIAERNRAGARVTPSLTRRDLLRTGTAAGAMLPNLLDRVSAGSLDIRGDERRLAFLVDGIERWVIEPTDFDGNATLEIRRRNDSGIRFGMRDARFPGTALSAAFSCVVEKHALGWSLDLHADFGTRFRSRSLVAWLLGDCELVSNADSGEFLQLPGGSLALISPCRVAFEPQWKLRYSGRVRAVGAIGEIEASNAELSITRVSDASLLKSASPLRTAFVLRRDPSFRWDLRLETLQASHPWRLTAEEGFNVARIEAAGRAGAPPDVAICLSCTGGGPAFAFEPGGALTNEAGGTFRALLHGAALGIGFSEDGVERVLMARLSDSGTPLRGEDFGVELRDGGAAPAFEMHALDERVQSLTFAPEVVGLSVPLEGGIVATAHIANDTSHLHFWWETLGCAIVEAWRGIRVAFDPKKTVCRLPVALTLLRPRDLLVLDIRFRDVYLDPKRRALVPDPAQGSTPTMTVFFPPQSLAERAYLSTASTGGAGEEPPQFPAESRIAGRSRLVFDAVNEIPFTIEGLLAWDRQRPRLAANAHPTPGMTPEGHPIPKPVGDDVTAIEAPYRLLQSPYDGERWEHTTRLSEDDSVETELWHTRLTSANASDEAGLRAIWSPDAAECFGHFDDTAARGCPANLPFRTSLDRRDRREIVRLSSDFSLRHLSGKPRSPDPINARNFMMSALGAWMDLHASWNVFDIVDPGGPPAVDGCQDYKPTARCQPAPANECPVLSLEEWKHRATMGRDNFVRVAYAGFLCPFGHYAVLVKESEREISGTPVKGAPPGAYVYQRRYVLVRTPSRDYPPEIMKFAARGFPYRRVEIKTLVTPTLDAVNPVYRDAFWPHVGGDKFRFEVLAEDRAEPGQQVRFSLPLIWVPLDLAFTTDASLKPLLEIYNTPDNDRCTTANLRGQKVAFAVPSKQGDTSFVAETIRFGTAPTPETNCGTLRAQRRPRFEPYVQTAAVRIPAVERVTNGDARTNVKFPDAYLEHGFAADGNRGDVYLIAAEKVSMAFPGELAGALATPDIEITSLSRLAGPVAGKVKDFTDGVFQPFDFFERVGDMARLLGVIDLREVIAPVKEVRSQLDKVPQLIMEEARAFDTELAAKARDVVDVIARAVGEGVEPAMRRLCTALQPLEAAQEHIHELLDELQGQVNELFGGIFTDQLKQQPLWFEPPPRCVDGSKQPRWEVPSGVPVRSAVVEMEARADIAAAMTVSYGPAYITFRELHALCEKLLLEARRFQSITQTDLQRIEAAFDLGPKLQGLLSDLRTSIQTEATRIAALGHVPFIRSFREVMLELKGFSGSEDLDQRIEAFGRILKAAQRFANEAGAVAAAPPDQFLIGPIRNGLSNARTSLASIARSLDSDLKSALSAAKSEVAKTVDTLSADAKAALQATLAVADEYAAQERLLLAQSLTTHLAMLEQIQQRVNQALAAVAAFQDIGVLLTAASHIGEQIKTDAVREISKPREVKVTYSLAPDLRSVPASAPVFEANPKTTFGIKTTVTTRIALLDLAKTSTSFQVHAKISDFKLHLFPFAECLTLDFDSITITADGTGQPDVKPLIRKVEFGQALKFVATLQDKLPFNKGNGLVVGVGADTIDIGYRFAIPNVTVGAMTLKGVSFTASLELPFRGSPARVRFAFADRDRPFVLAVGILGGGGFLAISLGADKIERLEGAFEFGATAELDLGPAHGEAHIFAGIYLSVDPAGARLSGFLTAGGSLDILGLITMSVELYLGFTYESTGNRIYGDAIVDVSIHLGPFYSIDVHLRCHREFSGGSAQKDLLVLHSAQGVDRTALLAARRRELPPRRHWREIRDAFVPREVAVW